MNTILPASTESDPQKQDDEPAERVPFLAASRSRGEGSLRPFEVRSSFQRSIAMLGVLAATSLVGIGCNGCSDHPHRRTTKLDSDFLAEEEVLKVLRKHIPKVTISDQEPPLLKTGRLQELSDDELRRVSGNFSQRAEELFQQNLASLLNGKNFIRSAEHIQAIEDFLSQVLSMARTIPELETYLADLESDKNYSEISRRLAPLFLNGGYYFSAQPMAVPVVEENDSPDTMNVQFFFFKINKSQTIQLNEEKGLSNSLSAFTLSDISAGPPSVTARYESDLRSIFVMEGAVRKLMADELEDPVLGPHLFPLYDEERAEVTASLQRSRFIHGASFDFLKKRFPETAKVTTLPPFSLKIFLAPGLFKEIEGNFTPVQIYNFGAIGIELYHDESTMPVSFVNAFQGRDDDFTFLFINQILPFFVIKGAPPSKAKEDLIEILRKAEERRKTETKPFIINTRPFVELYLDTFTKEDKEKLALRIYETACQVLDEGEKRLQQDSDPDDGQKKSIEL